jgi:hypothetical protein
VAAFFFGTALLNVSLRIFRTNMPGKSVVELFESFPIHTVKLIESVEGIQKEHYLAVRRTVRVRLASDKLFEQ